MQLRVDWFCSQNQIKFRFKIPFLFRIFRRSVLVLHGGSDDNPDGASALVLSFWEHQLPTLMKHVQRVLKTSDKIFGQATSVLKGLQSTMDSQHLLATQAWERLQKLQTDTNIKAEHLDSAVSEALDAIRKMEGSLVMNLCSMLLALRKAKALKESVDVINRLTDGGVMEELQEHVLSLRERFVASVSTPRLNATGPRSGRLIGVCVCAHACVRRTAGAACGRAGVRACGLACVRVCVCGSVGTCL